jgi:predicted NAD/FAD-binding protein
VEIDGVELDNGQHVLIGAYRECLRLMRRSALIRQAVLRSL